MSETINKTLTNIYFNSSEAIKVEDIKGVIRRHKSKKDRQYNGQT